MRILLSFPNLWCNKTKSALTSASCLPNPKGSVLKSTPLKDASFAVNKREPKRAGLANLLGTSKPNPPKPMGNVACVQEPSDNGTPTMRSKFCFIPLSYGDQSTSLIGDVRSK